MATRKTPAQQRSKKTASAARTQAAAKKPAAKKPAAKKPAAKKPAAKKPATKKPTAKKPAAKKPAAKKPSSRKTAVKSGAHAASVPASVERATVERTTGAATGSGKYVYCVIPTTEPLSWGPTGIGAEPAEVHTIGYRDIAAVVSDTPLEVYDPTRENVLAHQFVNETVMRNHTVIPMSFGTVFKTADDIVELLRSAYDAFHDVLLKMQNKLEFGLKVLWEPERVVAEIEREDEGARRLKAEISSERGSTYFARMQYGRLIESLLEERSQRYCEAIFDGLRDASVALRTNKPIGDKMILNAAFLVSRDDEAAFDEKVKALGARFDELTFKYTGPWPPYNFVNIRLKLERAKDPL